MADRAGAGEQLLARPDLVFLRQRSGCGGLGCRRHRVQVRLRAVAEVDRIELLAGIDRLVLGAVDLEDRQRALVEGAKDRMVDQHVAARHLGLEFNGDRAAGGDERGLHVALHARAALVAHLVEDRADDVEARDEVGAAVADEQAHRLAGLRGDGPVPRQCALGAVEKNVRGPLVDRLFHVERLQALLAILARGVEVPLHDVVLVIDLGQPFGRLDQDEPVHAVGDVHADRRRGAVVDVDPFVERLEGELRFVPRRGEARRSTAARPGDAVQVDVVRHLAAGMVLQVELDRVALTHSYEAARHRAAEGPERVRHAFGDLHVLLDDLEFDDHPRRSLASGRRRHVRRLRQHGADRCTLGRPEVAAPLGARDLVCRARFRRRDGNDSDHRRCENASKATSHGFAPAQAIRPGGAWNRHGVPAA